MINTILNKQDTCKYSNKDEAVKHCYDCGEGLCSACGYTDKDSNVRCNECHNIFIEESCPSCGSLEYFDAEFENTGFEEMPAYRPSKRECTDCGFYQVL